MTLLLLHYIFFFKKNLSENDRYKEKPHIPIVVGTDGLIFNGKIIK